MRGALLVRLGMYFMPNLNTNRGPARSRPGADAPDERRIVMAHTDSMPSARGANDNASGIGVVAALAGRLRLVRPTDL